MIQFCILKTDCAYGRKLNLQTCYLESPLHSDDLFISKSLLIFINLPRFLRSSMFRRKLIIFEFRFPHRFALTLDFVKFVCFSLIPQEGNLHDSACKYARFHLQPPLTIWRVSPSLVVGTQKQSFHVSTETTH